MGLNKQEVKSSGESGIDLLFVSDEAQGIIAANLVNFLVKKGIITKEEYLSHTEATKDNLVDKLSGKDDFILIVENAFSAHLNHLD